MQDEDKTKEQLITKLHELSERVSELEKDHAERERAEKALAEEVVRRRILFEQSRDGIVVLDQNGKVYEANQRYAEMLGYSAEEISELHAWDWDVQWTQAELLERMSLADAEGSVFETRHRRKDGTIYDVEISHNGVEFAGQKLVFCVCRDISQRKRAEERLRENQSRLDLAVRSAHMGVWSIDLIENKRHFDDQVCHLLGIDPAKFTGTADDFFNVVHPDDRDVLRAALARSIEQDALYEMEYRAVWPDGSVHYIIARAKLFRDETGQPVRVNGLVWDVTERAMQAREIVRLNRLYSVLSRVSQAVVRARSPETFLDEACREIVEGGGFLLAWIGQVELLTNTVVPTAFWGEIGEYLQGITVYSDNRPEGLGPTGVCIRENRPSVHNDFLNAQQTLPWRDRAEPFGIVTGAAKM